jgi:hypothetical protein
MFCGALFSIYFYFMGTQDNGMSPHDLHPRLRQHLLVDAVQARDLAVLVGEQRRPVEARLTDGPAEALGDLEVLAEMRGVGEQLLGDAADVDAGTAEAAVLGDRYLGAVGGRDTTGTDSAGAPADREEIKVEIQLRDAELLQVR